MHSDQSVRHIALTCPHCGKHYTKVPYEAIKKHQFAFCKQCNAKFRVEPSALEEALQQAARALAGLSLEVSESLSQHREHPTAQADEHEPGSDQSAQIPDTQTIPGLQDILQQAAGAARDFLPETPAAGEAHDDGTVSQLVDAQQSEAEEQPGIESSFEQKINKLAATIDETFGQPHEATPAVDTGGIAFENIFGDTSIDKTEAEQIPEPQEGYLTRSSAATIQELESIHIEDLIQYQPDEAPAEKTSEQDVFEVSLIQDQPADTAPEIEAGQEPFEEPLIEDQFVAASAESAFKEEIREELEELLIEDQAADASREIEVGQEPFEEPLIENQFIAASAESAFKEEIREELEELLIEDQAADASREIEAGQEPFDEPLIEDQFVAAFAETDFDEDPLEKVLIEDQAADASREIEAGQEPFDEPLIEDQFVATSAETAFGEETLDDFLIEDQSQEQFEQDTNAAIEAQEKNPVFAQAKKPQDTANSGFVASPDDSGPNRDVSAMLKDMMLPKAAIEEGTEQFVLFSLGEQMFAAPIANVFELSLPPDLIMVPNTPQWMLGVANLRGEIISIVDIRGFLNMEQESYKKASRMIIAQTHDKEMMVGLIVDRINGIKYFSIDEIEPFHQQSPERVEAYFKGACAHEDTMVTFLDFEQLLQSAKMRQFQ